MKEAANSGLVLCFAQLLASLSVDEMHPRAGGAGYSFIFVFQRIIIVQPLLNFHCRFRASENEMRHVSPIMTQGHGANRDLAQCSENYAIRPRLAAPPQKRPPQNQKGPHSILIRDGTLRGSAGTNGSGGCWTYYE